MDYSKKRWVILLASCFINLCIGSMYAWSVFSAPMADYLSQINNIKLTPADLSIVFVVANSIGPITMITGGKVNDVGQQGASQWRTLINMVSPVTIAFRLCCC